MKGKDEIQVGQQRKKHVCLLDMPKIMLGKYIDHEQRCKMVEHNTETLQNEKHLCKKTGGTFPG